VVIRNGSVISGTDLFYSGAPAAGNLVASISASGGTDSFGNQYLAGVNSYTLIGGTYFAIVTNSGVVGYYSSTPNMGPWALNVQTKYNGSSGYLEIGAPGAPALSVGDGVTATNIKVSSNYPVTADTWHNVTGGIGFQNGWADKGGGFRQVSYRKTPENEVEITGVAAGGTTTNNTIVFTLPAGYIPAASSQTQCPVTCSGVITGAPRIDIGTTGNVRITNVTGTDLGFNCRFSLD